MPALTFDDLAPAQQPKRGPLTFGDLAPQKSAKYIPTASFNSELDTAFGKGRWKATGDYRTPQREDQLRAQGAGTVAPGRVSAHNRGTPDAPGAHDLVVPGASPTTAVDRLQRLPGVRRAFYEGPAGSQGGHIHVDTSAGPLAFDDLAPAKAASKGPVSFDDLAPATAKPKTGPITFDDILRGAGRYAKEEFQSQIAEPAMRAAKSMEPYKPPPVRNPWDVVRGEVGGIAHDVKAAGDVASALMAPFAAPVHAGIIRPAAEALSRAGVRGRAPPESTGFMRERPGRPLDRAETEQQLEQQLGTAAMGLGPKGRVGRLAERPAIPLEPKLPKPTIPQAPRAPAQPTQPAQPTFASRPGSPSGLEDLLGPTGAKARQAVPNLPPAKTTMVDRMRDTGHAIQRVFSPETTAQGRPVAEQVRRSTGEHYLYAAQAEHQLVRATKAVDRLSEQQRLALINDIEHRTDPGHTPGVPELKSVTDMIGKTYDDTKAHIERVMGATEEGGPSFVKDYYTHLWQQNPDQVEEAMRPFFARQGSGKSLKQRSIPTIADGIAAGLTPVTTNPLEATSLYVQNMHRYLATHDIINHLTESGTAKWLHQGEAPRGWAPLDGIGVTRAPRIIQREGELAILPERKLYAPRDAAAVYNSFAGRGFEGGKYRPLYQGIRAAANMTTMVKLGLSAYHASAMAVEAAASGAARTVMELSRGNLIGAARAAPSAVPGLSMVKAVMRGRRLEQELLGIKTPDSLSKAVNDAFVESGGRLRMDPTYRALASGSFYNAFKRGAFKTALEDAGKRLYAGTAWDRVKGALRLGANVIQSLSAPLFEDVIPNVKRGVFADAMADWLRANPEATQYDVNRFAIKLNDSMDNRFGEMVQDNLFWDRHAKQTLQLLLLSPSWNIGTIRELAGGIADVPQSIAGMMKGKGVTPRTGYVVGLAFTVATINAVAQYLMTGKPPKSTQDLMAARTGGTVTTSGGRTFDERLMVPGNQKDVYAFVNALSQGGPGLTEEAKNKLNPPISASTDLLTNANWRGDPLYRAPGVPYEEGDPSLGGAMAREFAPVSLEMMEQRKPGTNIPVLGTMLGARPAPEYLAAPEMFKEQRIKRERRRLNMMKKRERKEEARK